MPINELSEYKPYLTTFSFTTHLYFISLTDYNQTNAA